VETAGGDSRAAVVADVRGRRTRRAGTDTLAVESNLGWKGPDKYVATVPQIFDLWQDPQERYDIFMNNYTERTWTLVTFNEAVRDLMKTYIQYPPRKLQSEVYTGLITISQYQRLQYVREQLEKGAVNIPLPTGNESCGTTSTRRSMDCTASGREPIRRTRTSRERERSRAPSKGVRHDVESTVSCRMGVRDCARCCDSAGAAAGAGDGQAAEHHLHHGR
jgi:hypothetical protein